LAKSIGLRFASNNHPNGCSPSAHDPCDSAWRLCSSCLWACGNECAIMWILQLLQIVSNWRKRDSIYRVSVSRGNFSKSQKVPLPVH
ncbi:MAG: hypothetical protein Q4F84_02110, partial [Fibrobacter sp.]|nr:hypothetical protein [Fibrobacter sp.]